MNANLFVFILLMLPQIQNLYSQSISLLSTEDGLSNNIVYDIQKDDKGFIWFATDNGLNRYNGYSFTKFYHKPENNSSIASNVCRSLLKDKQGNLWIATKKGISLYNPIKETFINYISQDKDLDVKELLLVGDDKIWFNTLGAAGFFDIKSKEFRFISEKFKSFCITTDGKKVWINSEEGSFDSINENSREIINITSNIGVRKQIHFGKYSQKLWLPKSDYKKNNFYSSIPKLPDNIQPTKLLEINKNLLLIGTNDGLFEYHTYTKKLRKKQLSKNETSLNLQIRSIYKDDIGNLWIGTLGGVFYIDYYKKEFQHLQLNAETDNVIMGLSSNKNMLYFNEFGKAFYKYSVENKNLKKLNILDNLSKGGLFVWDIKIIEDHKYPIWLSTNLGLICANENETNKISLPKGKDFYETSFNIFDTEKEFTWVASHTGIHQLSKKNTKIKPIKSVVDIALESNVQKILGINNKVFIATEGKGLFLYDEKTEEIKPMYYKKDKIINSAIWDMILVDNTIWLGTNEGLYSLNITTLNLKKIDVINSIIFSIQKDSFNRLWMGTDKGLMSYNLKTKYIDVYTKEEGVLNLEFNRRSSTKSQNGQFWFGGIKGITNFYPSKIKENTVIPKVHITKLNVIASDTTFVYNHREKKSVILPYNQNTISLEYVALNYTNSSQNKYKYQLVGRDKNWVEDNGFRFSRYVQLPPGKYNFKVIAANNDGLWNKKGDELLIEIMPPFWKTLWFQILIFITIAGVIYGVYYYRLKSLLAVERMKLRIASDLHDEVGSGLSSIALTSDILEQQYNRGDIKPHLLSRIKKNARNLAATLDDIVWLINPEKETLGDFLMKSKTLSQELLNDIYINFNDIILDDDKKRMLTPEQKRNLFLFIKEAVNNIVKHADAKNVNMIFKLVNSQFYLTIKDDGKGFDTYLKTTRNGLASLKNRAEILRGKYTIFSKINEGTTIELQIRIP